MAALAGVAGGAAFAASGTAVDLLAGPVGAAVGGALGGLLGGVSCAVIAERLSAYLTRKIFNLPQSVSLKMFSELSGTTSYRRR